MDDNDRHRAGTLPDDPTEDAVRVPHPLARLSVRAAVADLVDFLNRAGGRPAGMLPDPESRAKAAAADAELSLPLGAALPPEDGYRGPDWPVTDQLIGGGWWPDTLTLLIGGTGRGKTAFAVQVAEAAARGGAPTLYVSAELSPAEVAARLIALRARGDRRGPVAFRAVLHGRVPLSDVQAAGEALAAACPSLYVWAPPGAERTAAELRKKVEAVSAAYGGAPPVVVVDYVQRFTPPVDERERRMAVSALSGEMRELSRPSGAWPGAAVLALSSAPRASYATLEGTEALRAAALADVEGTGKESGELEYDAATVAVLTIDPSNEVGGGGPRAGLLRVVKARLGVQGMAWYAFDGRCGKWEEADPAARPEKPATGEEKPATGEGKAPRKRKPAGTPKARLDLA